MTDTGYLLLDKIAAGGMAEVYRAKSLGVEGFEKIVAVKRILPALAEDAEFVRMFISEAKIAGLLSHANIAQILELGRIEGTHFIAMEYVWGKDLRRILTRFAHLRQPMPPPMAAWIVAKMLEALDHAHRKRGPDGRPLGIIHRDVSPQNVLVSYDGLVKLIDFGIAKAAGRADQTRAGVIKGKLAYMSPEQVRGLPIDHRSDLFATTSCFYELLTGHKAFDGASDIDVIDRVREARCDPPSALAPHIPPALDAIVVRGFAKDIAERFQTADEMHEAIMHFIATSRPPYGTSDLSRWMRVAFAPEMAAEREHLDRLLSVSGAGVVVSTGAPRASRPDEPVEELSQIVMVEELQLEGARSSTPPLDEPRAESAPPVSASPAHERPAAESAPPAQAMASVAHPQHAPEPAPMTAALAAVQARYASPSAPPPQLVQPQLVQPQLVQPSELAALAQRAGEPAHAPVAQPAKLPSTPPPALKSTMVMDSRQVAAAMSSQPGFVPPPGFGATPVPVSTPHVSAPHAPAQPMPAPPPAPAPRKRRLWPIILLMLLLLAAGGGAAVWILGFGGRAVLGI